MPAFGFELDQRLAKNLQIDPISEKISRSPKKSFFSKKLFFENAE